MVGSEGEFSGEAPGASGDPGADVPTRVSHDEPTSEKLLRLGPSSLQVSLSSQMKSRLRHSEGARIGRYTLLRVLGEGGMGVVFAAYDEELDRKVAIKLVQAPRSQRGIDSGWLLGEAKAMAKLSHPNIVQIYDVGTVSGQVFVAMEFIVGDTLGRWFERPLGWREVVETMVQAGRGLKAVHDAGLVHCDFKPQNVIVGRDGWVRVLDFGLALLQGGRSPESDGESLRTSMMAGTPAYMAPEQHLRAPADARSDQFSFFSTLHLAQPPTARKQGQMREIAGVNSPISERASPPDAPG